MDKAHRFTQQKIHAKRTGDQKALAVLALTDIGLTLAKEILNT
ncbi:MAG: hypothetical protein AB8V19_04055 [Candidatus Midichloria sp.]|nr:hypothetical protein MHYMCMPSP_00743 [Hyalomma marginatum]